MRAAPVPMPRLAVLAVLAVLWPQTAAAHLVGIEFGGFYAGALHLITAPAHLAALLGLSVAAACQPRERARWTLAALPAGLAVGALAGALAAEAVLMDPYVAGTLLLAGIVAVAALRLPTVVIAALAAAIGLVLGADNGLAARVEEGSAQVPLWLYVSGVTVAGGMLGTLAVAAMTVLRDWKPWVPLAQRVLGSWMAAVGLIFLGLQVAQT